MDRVDTALMLAMLSLMAGTLLVGFSRPLWWMIHKRSPGGQKIAPKHYEWLLRAPGLALLAAAGCVIGMSVMGMFPFSGCSAGWSGALQRAGICDKVGMQTKCREVINMPQMNKGGKFIFGKSVIQENGVVQIPPQAIAEYRITEEGKVYLFTGSKSTGGFCVTRKGLLESSRLGHILTENPELLHCSSECGAFIPYKGRSYCWTSITADGKIVLSVDMMNFLEISPGSQLLSIRSSDIAFTMGAKGPLLERERNFAGNIPVF